MKCDCLPFRQIPHSTPLFLDYLDFLPKIRPFYPRSPHFLEWARGENSGLKYPEERRAQVAAILERQNRSWGGSPEVLASIERFRRGACAVITGQQVGLFGGPVFSLYKALSAIRLAKEAVRLGVDSIPIFWLAAEDHDLLEVDQVHIPGAEGRLETLSSHPQATPDAPVSAVRFGPEIAETTERTASLLKDPDLVQLLVDCYRPGTTFATAFAQLFARLFSDFGVVLLDGSDPELDQVASPIYLAAVKRAAELNRTLLARDQQLEAAGYHRQVRITGSSTLLFLLREGRRMPLHLGAEGGFLVGEEKTSLAELEELALSRPESLSPNVLLRPVIQDYLLPTLAYVGGAAEVAYFAQAGAVYTQLLARITPIVPRFSATLIEPKPQSLLEKYQLSLVDVFRGPEALREAAGAHQLPADLQRSFAQAVSAVEHSMKPVRESLERLDKTLVASAEHAVSKMLYQIDSLRARAARAELRQTEVIARHVESLTHALYPEKTLQERKFAAIYFLAKYGRELLQRLEEIIRPDCLDHQIVTL